ncbi:hypothetical protein N6G96_07275 [Pediococcus inopinatus]|uniref:ART-PolyVal-like domain-containing protein n=1 Tax=Pediococcus inopinatus TaxID=114090 RepID=A0ABZ0Q2D2_9LACO|nr:hypothetical protein [Pediococcus inopinatus]WPC19301.1 hypothetical protein N6G95_08700 [Pediococcus inopinatus]WPC21091.1 hypothetical protein N6G96_07275 [Pediococcus inopinatus]
MTEKAVVENYEEEVKARLINGTKFYHGSDQKFTKFDLENYGKNGVAGGRGIYITSSKKFADQYTGNIDKTGYLYQVDFKPGRELSAKKLTLTKREVSRYVTILDRKYNYLENWGDVEFEGRQAVKNEAVSGLMEGNSNDVDLYNEVINEVGGQPEALHALRQVANFTHSIVTHDESRSDYDEVVVLNPNDLKIQKMEIRTPKQNLKQGLKAGIQGIGGINPKDKLTR